MAVSGNTRNRELPVAEPTYPPPGLQKTLVPLLIAGVLSVCVLAGVVVVGVSVGGKRAKTVAGPSLTSQADRYLNDVVRTATGPALVEHYVDVALLDAPGIRTYGQRPPRSQNHASVRILSVALKNVGPAQGGGVGRRLLFVAYESDADARVSAAHAAETALAYVESNYRTYPTDAVTLAVWRDEAGQGRPYAMDFSARGEIGVAIVAVDAADDMTGASVALALGDPFAGSGSLISRWAEITAQ